MSDKNEVKKFFAGFRAWDWFVVFVVSDIGSTALVLLFTGGSGIVWYFIMAGCIWWLHIFSVQNDIKKGLR